MTKENVNLGVFKECKDYDVEMKKVVASARGAGNRVTSAGVGEWCGVCQNCGGLSDLCWGRRIVWRLPELRGLAGIWAYTDFCHCHIQKFSGIEVKTDFLADKFIDFSI